jgi:hypothetical protein
MKEVHGAENLRKRRHCITMLPGLVLATQRGRPTVMTAPYMSSALHRAIAAVALLIVVAACEPAVKVEAPKEPITINLNIKLDAEVRVRLEEQAKEDIKDNPDIF